MNWQRLSHLTPDERRTLQNHLVRNLMRHQLPYSPFYRELFKKHNLNFNDIRTTDDLIKIPFVTKADLAPTEDDRAKPKRFILQPDEQLIKKHAPKLMLVRLLWMKLTGRDPKPWLEHDYKPIHLHFTTGRTALPTPFAYSARDLDTLRESGERMLETTGISRDLVAINGFPYSPHLAFWLAYHALTKLGLTSLQTGGGKIMGTAKIIDATERLKAGVVTFIPGYCYHLFREAAKQGRDFSSLKYIIFGGERVSPGLREKVNTLAQQLKADHPKILATYALTEGKTAWIQCHEQSGYHTYPDLEYFEVVNKEGQRVKPGEPGEIVYTALGWRGSIVIRYRTGDLVKGLTEEPCPHCGKTVPIIHPDIQRSSELREFHLTKVKGELVNLNNFYPLLSGIQEIEEWQVSIQKKNNDPYDVDELIVEVAPKSGVNFAEFKPRLEKTLTSEVGVGVSVKQGELEPLLQKIGMETELKDKRIVDLRPK